MTQEKLQKLDRQLNPDHAIGRLYTTEAPAMLKIAG
jgi:hypothetical protein